MKRHDIQFDHTTRVNRLTARLRRRQLETARQGRIFDSARYALRARRVASRASHAACK